MEAGEAPDADLAWLRDNRHLLVGDLGEDESMLEALEDELRRAGREATPSPLHAVEPRPDELRRAGREATPSPLHAVEPRPAEPASSASSSSTWAGQLERLRMVDAKPPPSPDRRGAGEGGGAEPGGGWVRATDPDSGYDYFYDPATGASAWAHEIRPDPNDPTPRTTTAPAPSPRGGVPARHATTTVVERRPREHAVDDDGGSDGGYDDDDSADDDDDDDDDECCCCCFGAPKPKHPYKAIELHAS